MAEFLSSDPDVQDAHPHTVYDLVANICHDGKAGAGQGTYRVHLRHKAILTLMFFSLLLAYLPLTVYMCASLSLFFNNPFVFFVYYSLSLSSMTIGCQSMV